MPTFTDSTPRHAHTAAGETIHAPYVFAEGHALTAKEAYWLNSNLAGVVANSLAGDVRRAKDAGKPIDPTTYQSLFDEKFARYELGESNRGSGEGASTDPVERAAHRIATDRVKALAKAKGLNIRTLMETKDADGQSKLSALIATYLERNPDVMELARAQVEAQAALVDTSTDDLFADIATAPAEEPATKRSSRAA